MKRTNVIYVMIIIMSTIFLLNVPKHIHISSCIRCAEKSSSHGCLPIESSTEAQILETKKIVPPKLVIILASLGRSGSTMIAELMATKDNSVLFFEPDHRSEHKACARVSECMAENLKNILSCEYDDNFEQWLKSKYVFLRYFHPEVRQCEMNQKCESQLSLRPLCRDSEYKLAKLIRVRLGFLESLLKDETIDLKIIYLVRDPRASGNSIKRMRWEDSPNVICPKIYDDLLAFDYLEGKYPQQLLKIYYEHFSLDPFNQSETLFNFAYGDKILPNATLNYLELHTKTEESGAMNTIRDSKVHYQKWRWEIKEATLKNLEKEPSCVKVLEKMKYNLFRNLTRAHNKNISLFIS